MTVGPDVPLRDIFSGKRAPTFAFNVNIKKTTPKNPPKEPGPTRPEVLAHPDYRAFVKKLKAIEDAGVAEVTLANEVDDTPSPPIDFEFITEHRLGEGVPDYDPGFFVACECTGGCDDPEECGCLEGHEYRYDDYGRVRNILNLDTPIYECSDLCSCGSDCRNRVVQNGRKIKLQIFKTEKKGWGDLLLLIFSWLNILTLPRPPLPRTHPKGHLRRPLPRRGDRKRGGRATQRRRNQARPQLPIRPRRIYPSRSARGGRALRRHGQGQGARPPLRNRWTPLWNNHAVHQPLVHGQPTVYRGPVLAPRYKGVRFSTLCREADQGLGGAHVLVQSRHDAADY